MRTFSRYGTALLAAVMAGGLALSGCAGSTDSDSSAAGSDEGPITVACGAMEDLCQAWTDKFTEQTGIKATYVRLSSGETVARLASAKDNPEFDVWHGGPVDGYGEAVNQGLIEAYTSPRPPRFPTSTRTPTATGPASTSARSASAPTRPSWTSWAWTSPTPGTTCSTRP